jgi:predicted nucleic acid-binding protein
MILVADASPIISFARAERLGLLHQVAGTLWIPDAVFQEIVVEGRPGATEVRQGQWLRRQAVMQTAHVGALPRKLGRGEREAIILAEELHGVLLVDDPAARQEAARRHVPVLGSLSILRTAKRHGLIPDVTSHLNALRATGFRISDELSTRFLRDMGEV